MFEVPRAFGAFDSLFKNLGTTQAPTASDYAVFLKVLTTLAGPFTLLFRVVALDFWYSGMYVVPGRFPGASNFCSCLFFNLRLLPIFSWLLSCGEWGWGFAKRVRGV